MDVDAPACDTPEVHGMTGNSEHEVKIQDAKARADRAERELETLCQAILSYLTGAPLQENGRFVDPAREALYQATQAVAENEKLRLQVLALENDGMELAARLGEAEAGVGDMSDHVVWLDDRDLSALKFATQLIRGYEEGLENRHPDDPNPVTGTRQGEATSDVLAAIVTRATLQTREKRP